MSDTTAEPTTDLPPDDDGWDAELIAAMEEALRGTSDADVEAPEAPEAAEEPEAPEVAQEAPEPVVEEPEAPTGFDSVLGQVGMSPEDAEQIIRWASTLTPEQVQAVNAALSPTTPEPAASGHGSPGVSSPAPGEVPPIPDLPDLSLLQEAVPGIGDFLQAQRQALLTQQQELEALRSQQRAIAEAEAKRNQSVTSAAVDAGIAAFRETYPDLAEEQVDAVLRRATDLQVLGPLTQQFGGDVAKATTEALNTAMWSDPTMQQVLVQQRLDALASERSETEARRRRAASLSGSSGSVPGSRSSAAPANLTPEQRRDEMVKAVAAEIAGRAS